MENSTNQRTFDIFIDYLFYVAHPVYFFHFLLPDVYSSGSRQTELLLYPNIAFGNWKMLWMFYDVLLYKSKFGITIFASSDVHVLFKTWMELASGLENI